MLDAAMNKKDSIERCVGQIRAYFRRPSDIEFEEDYLRQDAIALNLQRVTQLCIDLANMTIRLDKLGLPKDSGDSFRLLAEAGLIDRTTERQLRGMVGFRNVLVHEYRKLDISLMVDVIENHLDDSIAFAQVILVHLQQREAR